jgi:hypothetical protein
MNDDEFPDLDSIVQTNNSKRPNELASMLFLEPTKQKTLDFGEIMRKVQESITLEQKLERNMIEEMKNMYGCAASEVNMLVHACIHTQ